MYFWYELMLAHWKILLFSVQSISFILYILIFLTIAFVITLRFIHIRAQTQRRKLCFLCQSYLSRKSCSIFSTLWVLSKYWSNKPTNESCVLHCGYLVTWKHRSELDSHIWGTETGFMTFGGGLESRKLLPILPQGVGLRMAIPLAKWRLHTCIPER